MLAASLRDSVLTEYHGVFAGLGVLARGFACEVGLVSLTQRGKGAEGAEGALRLFCFQRFGETLLRLICGEVAADGGDYVFLKNFEFQQFVIFQFVGFEVVKGIFNIFRHISASLQFVTLAA